MFREIMFVQMSLRRARIIHSLTATRRFRISRPVWDVE